MPLKFIKKLDLGRKEQIMKHGLDNGHFGTPIPVSS